MKPLGILLLIGASAFAQTPAAPAALPSQPGLYAIFETELGPITAKLFEKDTPNTVKTFVALARGTQAWRDPETKKPVLKPLYNNITFHRVIPYFMIQTGDPTGTGAHDCGFTIKDEILPGYRFDQPGRLAMANIGQPNTGGCQVFITEDRYPSGNGQYTIFGQVVSGQQLVPKISHVKRDKNDKPVTPVKLITVRIERVGPEPAVKAPKQK